MVVAVSLKLLYTHRNKITRQPRKEELAEVAHEQRLDVIEAEENLTDRKNRAFIYVY